MLWNWALRQEQKYYLLRAAISKVNKKCASSGNQTRASRVAGENSTTEPTMLTETKCVIKIITIEFNQNINSYIWQETEPTVNSEDRKLNWIR